MSGYHYQISEASRLLAVEAHVLRYWEEELGMVIPRNEMGHRYYTEDHLRIFSQIKDMKERGYQLRAIRAILSGEEPVDAGGDRYQTESRSESGCQVTEIPVKKESAGKDGSGTVLNVYDRQGNSVNVQDRQGSPVNVQDRQGSLVNVQDRQGSLVNAQDRQGSSVNAQDRQGSSVNVQNRQGSSVNVQDRQGSSVNGQNRGGSIRDHFIENRDIGKTKEQNLYPAAERNGKAVGYVQTVGGITGISNELSQNEQMDITQEDGNTVFSVGDSGHAHECGEVEAGADEKMHRFQAVMTHIVAQAMLCNNSYLAKEVSQKVENHLLPELEVLVKASESRQEERFRKLDESIRMIQQNNRVRYEAAASRSPFSFGRKKKKKISRRI